MPRHALAASLFLSSPCLLTSSAFKTYISKECAENVTYHTHVGGYCIVPTDVFEEVRVTLELKQTKAATCNVHA